MNSRAKRSLNPYPAPYQSWLCNSVVRYRGLTRSLLLPVLASLRLLRALNVIVDSTTADAYIMKHIIHDWNDEECVRIFSNLYRAASKDARVFIAEYVVPGPETPHFAKLFDIHMMCWGTGRERTNHHAAGIDVGAETHYVAVPPESAAESVREFGVFTGDLHALADWLKQCKVTTVALESTGVYWIPLYELLEQRGLEVKLVDARKVKNVSGRKSDVLDCQWLQQLHTYGLLAGAFRPADEIVVLRAFLRQREMLVRMAAKHIQHIQKALQQMNLRLDNVVSDVTGETGLAIIKAVLKGERDPAKLAALRNFRCHRSEAEIAESLIGNYRTEHLFALRQAVELYEQYRAKIVECEEEIERYLKELPTVTDAEPPAGGGKRSTLSFDVRRYLYQQLGVDLLRIGGINAETALVIYSEVGRDLSRFPTAKHFASWLSVCPGTKISGGRVLARQTQKNRNRAAAAFRRAAVSVGRSESALGAFYRRLKNRVGAAAAATATAHKLARLYWTLLQRGQDYVDAGAKVYEERYRQRVVTSLRKRAKTLGYDLAPLAAVA